MRSKRRFVVESGVCLAAVVATFVLLAWLLQLPELYATKAFVSMSAATLVWMLWRQVQRTNLAVASFVAALDRGDLAQEFQRSGQGTGFDALGAAFDSALRHRREERAIDAADYRFATALVDEAPTPLLAIDPCGVVQLSNKQARRMFGGAEGRRIAEFGRYGEGFATALAGLAPGERRMCRITVGERSERATVSCTGFDRNGAAWRLVSVQVIQSELDAAEIATQSDLVRVLTHEIMNSVTPVTSLAASAAHLMAAIDDGSDATVTDARMAVEALSRRAAGIMHFVESYRQFSTVPSITVERFAARPWLDELARLHAATPRGAATTLTTDVRPDLLEISADRDLISQVLLNLLKNGAEAAIAAQATPLIAVAIEGAAAGRTRIVVDDNGPGIPEKVARDIFLPFFTTKADGNGVGLSFARQIVLLHDGAIEVGRNEAGGARFEMII